MRGAAVTAAAIAAWLTFVVPASAQTPSMEHRFIAAGGIVWSGGYNIGDASANLRSSAPGPQAPPLTLFKVESMFDSAFGVEGRFGFALTPTVSIEAAASWSRPHIRVSIADDMEAGDVEFDGEPTTQYAVEGSLVWKLRFTESRTRVWLYVIAGGGYLRQLHEDNALAENGQRYHLGAGVQYLLHGHDGGRPVGLRGDLRAYLRKGGIELADKTRLYPSLSALVFVGF